MTPCRRCNGCSPKAEASWSSSAMNTVKGVIGQRQLIKALSQGVDASAVQCHQHMEMDFAGPAVGRLKTVLLTSRSEVLAVVAVDENDEFIGYFSPGDYQSRQY